MSHHPEQHRQAHHDAQNLVAPVHFTAFPMPSREQDAERFAAAGMDDQLVTLAVGSLVSLDTKHRQEKVNMHKQRMRLEDARDAAEHSANTDELTHLNNRRGFRSAMEAALEEARSNSDSRWSLFYLDLDGFKAVNDRYGHPTGDVYLKAISDRLRLRTEDVIGRVGGDEFVIFAKTSNDKNGRRKIDISDKEAKDGIKNKIRQAVEDGAKEAEELTNTYGSNVSASIGEVAYTGTESVDELLQVADNLMLLEKDARKKKTPSNCAR